MILSMKLKRLLIGLIKVRNKNKILAKLTTTKSVFPGTFSKS